MKQFANDTEYKIHWLRRASIELETIYRFYGHFASELVAKRRVGKIIHSVGLLENSLKMITFTSLRYGIAVKAMAPSDYFTLL